ncbi:MAG TPA: hypothetical protein VMU45_10400 [Candidatus Eisenbacteria bacterium]|nr:hypothetical protein [Candidatus Eisenbacteria bacterium]
MFLLIASALVKAQSTPQASPSPQVDNRIFAELDKLTHAKRVKTGDVVTAHLVAPAMLPDGTELPKGSKLLGSVTDLKAKSDKQGPSRIGLLFTSVVPKNGKEMPIHVVLVAVAPHTQANDVDLLAAGNPYSGGNRMQAGSGANTLNTTTGEGEALSRGLGARAPAERGNVNTTEMLPGRSYLPEVVIASYSAASPGTVFVSKDGSVYLDAGVRLLLLSQ